MRSKLLTILVVGVAASVLSYLFSQWETGQLFPQSTESFLADIRKSDPIMYGIMRDNPDETEVIRAEFQRTKDGDALQKRVSDLAGKVAYPAYGRAGDDKVIEVVQRGRQLVEAFALHAREGCRVFSDTGNIVQFKSNPDIGPKYTAYSEAMLQAYEDGKTGSEKPRLLAEELQMVVGNDLAITIPDDLELSNPKLCEGLIKMYSIDQVREDHRGKYARFVLTGE